MRILAAGPGRSRADEGAPRFFAARRNGHPILCFIIGGRHRPKPTCRPHQSGRTTRSRRAVRSSVSAFTTGAIRLEHVPMRSTCATEPYGADTTGEEPAAHRRGKNSSTSAGTNSYAPRSRSSKAAASTGAAKSRSQRPGTLVVQKMFG